MRKFIYTILVLVIIVVAAFLISPYFLGSRAEQQFQDEIALFNKNPLYSSYVTITPENYQRHWFSSDATVKITFHAPSSTHDNFNESFTYNTIIKHGPLYVVSHNGKTNMHFGAGAMIIKGDSADFNGIIAITAGWNNQLKVFADIPTLILKDSENNQLTFHDLTFNTQLLDHGNAAYTLELPKITANMNSDNADGSVTINNTKFVMKGRMSHSLWLGSGELTFADIVGGMAHQGATTPMISLKGFSTNFENDLSNDKTKFNSQLNLNIVSLSALGYTVKPITISFSSNDLNAQAYEQFSVALNKIQNAQLTASTPSTNDLMDAINALSKIIESGFTLELNKVYVGLPKNLASSPLSASAQLTVKPITDLSQKINMIMSAVNSIKDQNKTNDVQQTRDDLLSDLTNSHAAPGSAQAQEHQQVQAMIAKSIPMLLSSLVNSVVAHGEASIPVSLVKQALLQQYTEQLMHMAAHGQDVTQTPQDLATAAYKYLVTNKMLMPDNAGAVRTSFKFADGQLTINGEKPALDLPKASAASSTPEIQPGVTTPTPSSDTQSGASDDNTATESSPSTTPHSTVDTQ